MSLGDLLKRQDLSSDVKEVISNEFTKFKKLKEESFAAKNRLDYLLRSGPAIIYTCEIVGDLKTVFMSENVKEILGYSPENFLHNSHFWVERLHPDEKQEIFDAFLEIIEKNVFNEIYRFKHQDGTYRWMHESTNLIRDEGGRPLEIVGYWTDITSQKNAEDKLRREKDNFYNILNTTHDLICIVNSHYEFEYVNGPFKKEFDPVDGKKCYEIFGKTNEVCSACKMKNILKGETVRFETTAIINNKTYDSINLLFRNLDGSDSLISFFRDITERKHAEEQLRESEELFTQFMNHLPASAFIKDKKSTIIFANKYLKDVFGTAKWIGKTATDLFPEVEANLMLIADKIALKKGLHITTEKLKDKNNVFHTYRTYKFPIKRKNKTTLLGGISIDISELVEAEKKIRDSENKYRNLIEQSADGIALTNEDGRIIQWNKSMEEISELKKEDTIGKFVWDINFMLTNDEHKTSEHYNKDKRIFVNLLETGESTANLQMIEDDFFSTEGTERVTQYQIFPIKTIDGYMICCMVRDITERKKAEVALKKSETKYRLLFESAPIGIGIADFEGKVLNCNQRFLEITGYTIDEIKNAHIEDRYAYPEDRTRLRKTIQDHGQIRNHEIVFKRKNGSLFYSELNVNRMELEDQKVVLITLRDLTDWREVNKAKIETEERLRKFMDSATDGFTLLDSNLTFIDMNKAGLEAVGLSREEVIGRSIMHVFPDLKKIGRYDIFKEIIETGKPYHIDSIISAAKIGKRFFSIRAFKVGEGLGILTTDITDRAKTEKARQELEQRRDSFVWMTSHELRTPLTVLAGYCDFLTGNNDQLSQERRLKILDIMKNNLNRLEHLINEVSTVGQIQRGFFYLDKTDIELSEFIRDIALSYQHLLGDQFKLELDSKDQQIIIEGDPNRLQQVFDNILGNAIKQTDKTKRKIKVALKVYPDRIIVRITDNGAGVDPKNIETIFEQFVSISTEFSATGTGMGLYISRKIIEFHNGIIIAQSKGQDKGTTFVIELPRKKE